MTIDFKNKIYLGVASPVEDGDMSNYYTKAQTRALVDAKQDVITGAATTITENNLTANRALTSDANGKVDVATTTTTELNYVHGVTSAIQTQLNAKASTALDNLSSNGQMIIDSANGTISNCILEIPQNLKLTLENNVLTLKAGSYITECGSTYAIDAVANDISKTFGALPDGKYYIFSVPTGIQIQRHITEVTSGTEPPATGTSTSLFFNTNDKGIYAYNTGTNTWVLWSNRQVYPICILEFNSGVASFAKDSNGNDMIFNGACFVGHHAVIYPNVKGLDANGKTLSGNLASVSIKTNSLQIIEMPTNAMGGICLSNTGVVNLSDTNAYYDEKNNLYYRNSSDTSSYLPVSEFTTNLTNIVTDFTIRQPVRTATVEMVDKKQDNITLITGYDATKTQTLKNVSGVLTWVDD